MGRGGAHTQKIRLAVQAIWAVITNGYLTGFLEGKIYTGRLKSLCVPGLNCYSCPGALGACPIGALQAVLGSSKFRFSFYLFGFFMVVGVVFARFVCGFLCPFGLVQELLHRIPFPKKIRAFKGDRLLRGLKYLILVVFVILLPLVIVDAVGSGSPWFCKLICPAGTLEGGIPLVSTNPMLQGIVGFLFKWKVSILVVTVVASILIYRPFCKYICPLGAIYALFNKVSLYRYRVDGVKCVDCGKCAAACPMVIDPQKETNHPECVRCGVCKTACPTGAITSGFCLREKKDQSGPEAETG